MLKMGLHSTEVAQLAKDHLCQLTGLKSDTVTSVNHDDAGWHVSVVLIELKTVTGIRDVLAVYETMLDEDGEIISYQRTRRYHRGEVVDE